MLSSATLQCIMGYVLCLMWLVAVSNAAKPVNLAGAIYVNNNKIPVFLHRAALGTGKGLHGGVAGPNPPPPTHPTIPPRRPTVPTKPPGDEPGGPPGGGPPGGGPPGGGPPGGGHHDFGDTPFCIDLIIVFDTSCSILLPTRQQAMQVTVGVIRRIFSTSQADVRVALLLYSEGLTHKFYLNEYVNEMTNAEEIVRALETADLSSIPREGGSKHDGCRTQSHLALRDVRESYLLPENGNRPDNRDVVLFVTDGRTIQQKFREDTLEEAQKLKGMGVEINILAAEHRSNRPSIDEFELVPTSPQSQHFFMANDTNAVNKIMDVWNRKHGENCPSQDALACVDVVFAFDFSCSINLTDRNLAVNMAAGVVRGLVISQELGANVAAFSFDRSIKNHVPATGFYSDDNPQVFIDQVLGMDLDTTKDDCKTRNDLAFSTASNLLTNADRDDDVYGDVLVIWGDGRSAPMNSRVEAIRQAGKLADQDTTIIWVQLPTNRGAEKAADGLASEITVTATKLDIFGTQLYRWDNDLAVDQIINVINARFACPPQ